MSKKLGLMTSLVAMVAIVAVTMLAKSPVSHAHDHGVSNAICVMTPTEGSEVSAIITFSKVDDGVLIEGTMTGLKPNSKHGFHIHEYGDISGADGKKAGGHFNPSHSDHAGPDAEMRHVGDLGNVEADSKGNATYKRLDKTIAFEGQNNIVGRGMILHAGTDDLESQPTGAAGARIAQGVIGVAAAE